MLCWKFNTLQKFDVYIPQSHLCENGRQCSLFNENCCSVRIAKYYDLKAHGYDSCEIEYKFPNEKFSYDVVLRRGLDLKTAIVIVIDADTCHIEPRNLKNRTIDVTVRCESDIFELYERPLRGEGVRFLNFEHKNMKTSCKNINRQLLKFTLFSSGKYHLGTDGCMTIKKRSAVYEMIIFQEAGSYKKMKQYAVFHTKIFCAVFVYYGCY